jgi:hypothetical protein
MRLVPSNELDIQIGLATLAEKRSIVSILEGIDRQTMNLRLMPEAEVIVVKLDGTLIGWGGYSVPTQTGHQPEVFSLHVNPEYRGLHIGALIEYVRCVALEGNGVSTAYTRMTYAADYWLLSKRAESSYYSVLEASALDSNYVGLCQQCNIYGTRCLERIFLRIDVTAFREHGAEKFDHLDFSDLFTGRASNVPLKLRRSDPGRVEWLQPSQDTIGLTVKKPTWNASLSGEV